MLRIQITNTPELPMKKTPTFKRLWHMALQLWYHRQIIKRYKARPIKYKKAYHSVAADLKAAMSRYHHLDGLRRVVQASNEREIEQLKTAITKYKRQLDQLDHLATYHREFIITRIIRNDKVTPELNVEAMAHIRNEPKA